MDGRLNLFLLCLEGTKRKLFRVSSLCPHKDTELKWRNKLFPQDFVLKSFFQATRVLFSCRMTSILR